MISQEETGLLNTNRPVIYDGSISSGDTFIRRVQTRCKVRKMHVFLFFFVCLSTLIWMVFTQSFEYQRINTLISFGDSYTTRYLNMDSLQYACRECTSAGGPNWVVYLSERMEWISWDLAYNSAPVNNSIVNQVSNVVDVSTQIRHLYSKIFVAPTEKIEKIVKEQYKEKKRTAQSTLVTVWVGINDINLTFNWSDTESLDLLIMQRYQLLIDELIEKGEKQFMFINVPPIDRAPMWNGTKHEQLIQLRVKGYNSKLKAMVNQLKQNHSTTTFFQYDAWSFFNDVMDYASDYNLTDIDSYCPDWSHPIERHCKPIEQYFWLNNLHPTFRVHQLIAQDIFKYLSKQ